jgi:uncharacterized protein with von Willebrand factor type A (vWA) domain
MSASEKDLINLQWKDQLTRIGNLENMVPLVDVSGSMNGGPLEAAIALGICVAEKSRFGKRVLTFTDHPEWVHLNGEFTDMVQTL